MKCIYCGHDYQGHFCPNCYIKKPKNNQISLHTLRQYPLAILLIFLAVVFFVSGCVDIATGQNTSYFSSALLFAILSAAAFYKKKKRRNSQNASSHYGNWRDKSEILRPLAQYSMSACDTMDGYAFEDFVCDLLSHSGFTNVKRRGGSGDQGVDITAEKDGVSYAIQCKCYANPLGNTPVQEIHAGKAYCNCHVGVVATNSTFTKGAVELAEACNVLLWDRSMLSKMLSAAGLNLPISEETYYQAAIAMTANDGCVFVSKLQRDFDIGYSRAVRLYDRMQQDGIIGNAPVGKPAPVLIENRPRSRTAP